MQKRMIAILLCLCLGVLLAGCGSVQDSAAASAPADSAAQSEETPAPVSAEPAPEAESSAAEAPEEASVAESSVAEESAVEEAPQEPQVVTITFSTGETYEATVGEDFVFFFQCDAPGDMGAPEEGEEGAGITVDDGTVTYENVSLGGPYQYPTSEKVTISGFTGDVTVTVAEAATFMDATHTIYTDEQEIADAVAFADYMAAQQAANPMP